MIDRYLLRYFLAVVDEGSFSKAAALCNVSQPTLSFGIAKLERLLSRKLFLRTNRRVQLTEAGARFAVHARRIESEFNLAERADDRDAQPGIFRLGVLASTPTAWMAAFAARLAREHVGERVELVEGRERDLAERLARGRIHAALTILRPDAAQLGAEPLFTEGYALAVPMFHPLADEAAIEAGALADNVMIVRRHCEALPETSRHFTRRGVRPFFAARSTNDDRVLALVRAGLGITVMPECFSCEGVRRPRLAGFDLKRTIGIVHAGDSTETRMTADIIATLRTAVAEAR